MTTRARECQSPHECGNLPTCRVTFPDGTLGVFCEPCAYALQQTAEGTHHSSVRIEPLRVEVPQ